jgi:hypothetical protein
MQKPPTTRAGPLPAERGPRWHEIWSCAPDGRVQKHGGAFGLTFEDACKHLSCESVDFWKEYHKGRYRGRLVCESRAQALARVPAARGEAASGERLA